MVVLDVANKSGRLFHWSSMWIDASMRTLVYLLLLPASIHLTDILEGAGFVVEHHRVKWLCYAVSKITLGLLLEEMLGKVQGYGFLRCSTFRR